MNNEVWWNYGVLAVVALGCLVLVVRYFRRELNGKDDTGCGYCSSAGSCSGKRSTASNG